MKLNLNVDEFFNSVFKKRYPILDYFWLKPFFLESLKYLPINTSTQTIVKTKLFNSVLIILNGFDDEVRVRDRNFKIKKNK